MRNLNSDSELSTTSLDDASTGDDERETRSNSKASGGKGGRKSTAIIPRPNVSSGFWLCCLIPLAFITRYVHEPPCHSVAAVHKLLTVAATGMCVETLCFAMYMGFDTGIFLKLGISLIPGMLTFSMYWRLLDQSRNFSLLCGFGLTLLYQNVYIRVMRGLPRCFTYGEAAVIVQGTILFAFNAIYQLYNIFFVAPLAKGEFTQLNAIMIFALLCLLMACCLLAFFPILRKPVAFYTLMLLLLIAVTCTPVTQPLPFITLFNFIVKEQKRLYIIGFYLFLVATTIGTVSWQLRNSEKASTRVRKIFHLLIVFVYVPGLLFQCTFLYIASGVALAICTVLELVRILEMPPFANRLKDAFDSFKDEKDAGILALTPFCLLIGCSMPIWLSPCPCSATGHSILPLLSGILSVGFGDTAASIVGSKIGRNKWRNSSRSLEGTAAFIVLVLATVICLNLFGYLPMTQSKWFATIAATLNTALVEAHTDQIDNLVLPLVFYSIVSLA